MNLINDISYDNDGLISDIDLVIDLESKKLEKQKLDSIIEGLLKSSSKIIKEHKSSSNLTIFKKLLQLLLDLYNSNMFVQDVLKNFTQLINQDPYSIIEQINTAANFLKKQYNLSEVNEKLYIFIYRQILLHVITDYILELSKLLDNKEPFFIRIKNIFKSTKKTNKLVNQFKRGVQFEYTLPSITNESNEYDSDGESSTFPNSDQIHSYPIIPVIDSEVAGMFDRFQ